MHCAYVVVYQETAEDNEQVASTSKLNEIAHENFRLAEFMI
jgi:hypothetical protein